MSKDDEISVLATQVSGSLDFQRRWQKWTMIAYVSSTAGVLICTTAATFLAADDHAKIAAVLSAVSTVLIGIEKTLLFREKWKFHREIATRLIIISTQLKLDTPNVAQLTKEYIDTLSNYARDLPTSERSP